MSFGLIAFLLHYGGSLLALLAFAQGYPRLYKVVVRNTLNLSILALNLYRSRGLHLSLGRLQVTIVVVCEDTITTDIHIVSHEYMVYSV